MSTDCQINVGVTLDDSPVDVAAQLALYNVGGGAVDSVNGKTGVVVLDGTEVELIDGGGVSVTQAISDITTNYQPVLLEGAFVNGDKTKLDGIAAGATADQTVNGKTGASITLDGTEIDLIDGGGVSITQAVADLEDAIPDYLNNNNALTSSTGAINHDLTAYANSTLALAHDGGTLTFTNIVVGKSGTVDVTQTAANSLNLDTKLKLVGDMADIAGGAVGDIFTISFRFSSLTKGIATLLPNQ